MSAGAAVGSGDKGGPVKAVILAGGYGSRLAEETSLKPKPMIEIGGRPILWHILKIYSAGGVNDFVICCGYKGYVIKEYFANYFLHMSDVTFDMAKNTMEVHQKNAEPWRVTLVDTGEDSMTGGRLRRVKDYVSGDECFCFTYGDGLADIDIGAEIAFHRAHGKQATVTAVQPPGRYGALRLDGARVDGFIEKPRGDGGLINGGFFVLSPRVIDRIDADSTSWEQEPLAGLARDGALMASARGGFPYLDDLNPEQRLAVETLDGELPRPVGDFAGGGPPGRVAGPDRVGAGPQHDQVPRGGLDLAQPGDDVGAEDVVLDHDGEAGVAVLVRDRGGEPVPEVEQAPRLGFALVARVHPAADGPAVELAAADVHAAVELPGQPIGHRRLARRLHPGD